MTKKWNVDSSTPSGWTCRAIKAQTLHQRRQRASTVEYFNKRNTEIRGDNTFVRNALLCDHLNQLKTLQITDILFCIGGLIRKEIMAEIMNWTLSKRINISCSPSKGTMIIIIIIISVRRCYLESLSLIKLLLWKHQRLDEDFLILT